MTFTCKDCEYFVPEEYMCEQFDMETDETTPECPEFSHKDCRAITMNRFESDEQDTN